MTPSRIGCTPRGSANPCLLESLKLSFGSWTLISSCHRGDVTTFSSTAGQEIEDELQPLSFCFSGFPCSAICLILRPELPGQAMEGKEHPPTQARWALGAGSPLQFSSKVFEVPWTTSFLQSPPSLARTRGCWIESPGRSSAHVPHLHNMKVRQLYAWSCLCTKEGRDMAAGGFRSSLLCALQLASYLPPTAPLSLLSFIYPFEFSTCSVWLPFITSYCMVPLIPPMWAQNMQFHSLQLHVLIPTLHYKRLYGSLNPTNMVPIPKKKLKKTPEPGVRSSLCTYLFVFLRFTFSYMKCFAHVYVCVLCTCLVPMEVRREGWISWNWSYI